MKIYFDPVHMAPKGWLHTCWAEDAIECITNGQCKEISIGTGDTSHGTGESILEIISSRVQFGIKPPKILLHSGLQKYRHLVIGIYTAYSKKSLNPLWVVQGHLQIRRSEKLCTKST